MQTKKLKTIILTSILIIAHATETSKTTPTNNQTDFCNKYKINHQSIEEISALLTNDATLTSSKATELIKQRQKIINELQNFKLKSANINFDPNVALIFNTLNTNFFLRADKIFIFSFNVNLNNIIRIPPKNLRIVEFFIF